MQFTFVIDDLEEILLAKEEIKDDQCFLSDHTLRICRDCKVTQLKYLRLQRCP